MRFVSTALVMMAIALMVLALMLLTPTVRANPMTFVIKSEPCWTNEFEVYNGRTAQCTPRSRLQARQR